DETYFSRIHAPRDVTTAASLWGSHAEQWWYGNQLSVKRHHKWNRALSPAALFRWEFIEPTNDNFVWDDDDIDKARQSGQEVLGNLYQKKASWANRNYLKIGTPSGTFVVGETVTQTSTGASGTVQWVGTSANLTGYALQLSPFTGNFVSGSAVVGGTT